jgi:hypothetical protein
MCWIHRLHRTLRWQIRYTTPPPLCLQTNTHTHTHKTHQKERPKRATRTERETDNFCEYPKELQAPQELFPATLGTTWNFTSSVMHLLSKSKSIVLQAVCVRLAASFGSYKIGATVMGLCCRHRQTDRHPQNIDSARNFYPFRDIEEVGETKTVLLCVLRPIKLSKSNFH